MTDPLQDSFDTALRQHLHQGEPEPDDAGFSLNVMAALPGRVAPSGRRWGRRIKFAQWTVSTVAACGAATMFSTGTANLDAPHALAAIALLGLLIFWSIPSRWTRG
ncbi:hypothetical protein [Roseateles sp. P5_E8]